MSLTVFHEPKFKYWLILMYDKILEMSVRVLHRPIGTVVLLLSHAHWEVGIVTMTRNVREIWFVDQIIVPEIFLPMGIIPFGQLELTVVEVTTKIVIVK